MDKIYDFFYGPPALATKSTSGKVKPHRCAKHLEDLLNAMVSFEVNNQFQIFVDCMKAEPGNEPPRQPPVRPEPTRNV
ncbi:hypothetical protein DFQ27_005203 [Actinomortierella ambigua]|uniref:Uncharacterized protein n=1 Tax=Actinomortierella ambigua TaxID=1343610 RepID=A0A9P6Q2W2_9FUNG|nr:hypothetical protein DFQ27_005203 [Actinomortierella ambigua]